MIGNVNGHGKDQDLTKAYLGAKTITYLTFLAEIR